MGLIDSFPDTYLPRDAETGALSVIDSVHQAIHDGRYFTTYHNVTVGTGTAVSVMITTPAANDFHVDVTIESDKAVDWTFSEAPNASGGSALVSYNNNRKSTNTAQTTIVHTVTYTSSGTVLESHVMGTNEPTTKIGGNFNSRVEWEFANSTSYLIYATVAAATTKVNVIVHHYYIEE